MKGLTIAASDFKARCLRILDEVAECGEIVITKHGQPVAKLVPIVPERKSLRGRWQGQAKIKGDIVHFDTSDEWEALK